MSFTRKTFDTDSIVLKTIIARTPTDQSIPAGKVLVAQGDGSTAWLYPSTLPGVPAFTRVIGNGTEIVADNLSSAIVFSTLDSMGMIVNSTTKQISLYAKAFATIDISGGNSVTAYNTTNNTFTPTVELVGNSGIQISSDPQTNKIYFQTAPPTISTGIYGYQQVNVISNAPSTITDSNFSTANTYLTALSPSTVLQLVGLGDILLQTDVTNNVTYIGISTFTTASFQAVSTATGNVQTTGSTLSTTIGSNTSSLWFSTTTAMNSTNSQFQANFNYINSFYTPLYAYEDLSTFTHSTLANTSLASTFCTIYASSIFVENVNASSITLSSLRSLIINTSTVTTSSLTTRILYGNTLSTAIIQGSGTYLNIFGTTVINSTLIVTGNIIPNLTNRWDLGSAQYRWRDLYLSSGSIYLSTTKISLDSNGALQYSIGGGSNLPIGGGTSSFTSSFTANAFVSSLTASSITAVNFVYLSSVQDSYYISTTNLDAEEISYSTCFGQTLSTQRILASTLNGVNVSDYISTGQLISTVDSLGTIGYVSSTQLTSSITGLGEIGYISSATLVSTISSLGEIGYVSSTQLTSSITGLGSAGYISSATLVSTISSLGEIGYVSSSQLTSSITGLGTSGYVSSTQLTSSITGLATAGYVSSTQLTSSITGLATAGYVSSTQLTSSITGLGTSGYVSSTQLTSSITGLGTSGYVSSTQLTSSITGLATAGYVSSTQLTSSITGLGTSGYVSTFTLTSSLNGAVNNLGSLGYVSTSMMGNISSLNTSTIQHINSRYDSIQVPGAMTLNNALTGLVVGAINHVSTNAVKYAITNGTFNISSFSNATGVQYNFPLSTVIRSIAFSGKNWLMATSDTTPTNGRLYRSENGISWSQIIVQGNNLPTIINKIIYASTLWYAVGSNSANSNYTIARSTDGSNWTAASSGGFSGAGDSIAYNPLSNRFVAVGHAYTAGVSSPVIRFSDDMGSNWLNTTSFVSTGVTAGTSVFYANNLWLSGFNRTTGSNIKYSTNGSNWTDVPGVFFPQVVSDFAYGNSTWVAVGGSNFSTIRYSGNGTSWSNTSNSFTFGGKGVVWTGSVFAAVGSDPTSTSKVKYSTDGISWVNSLNADFSGEGDSIAYSSNVTLPTYTLDVTQGARLNRLDVPTTATISSLTVSSFQLPGALTFSSLTVSSLAYAGSAIISSATISSLGIGTTTPSYLLDVNSHMRALGTYIGRSGGSNTEWAFNSVSSASTYQAMIFGTSNSLNNAGEIGYTFSSNGSTSNNLNLGFYGNKNLVNILANGNVGIGTSNPTVKLAVSGGNIGLDNTGELVAKNSNGVYEGFLVGRWTNDVTYMTYGAGGMDLRNNATQTTAFFTNDNRVGIRTTVGPTAVLQVQQSTVSVTGSAPTLALANSAGSNQLFFCTRLGNQQYNGIVSTNDLAIIFTDGTGGASNRANFYIGPHSDTQGGIRMTYDGKVGINTITPTAKLDIIGPSSLYNAVNEFSNNSITIATAKTQSSQMLAIGNDQTNRGSYLQSISYQVSGRTLFLNPMGGTVGIGGIGSPTHSLQLSIDSAYKPGTTTWDNVSDERIKTNISLANLDICYSSIKAIPLKRYTWRDDIYTSEQVSDRTKIGWIAQDVEKVFPKAVTYMSTFGYDDCRGLNADQLYAIAYGATQKLIEIVETHTSSFEQVYTQQQTTEQRFSTLEQQGVSFTSSLYSFEQSTEQRFSTIEQQGVSTFMTISSFEGITEQRFSSLEAMFQITQSTCFGLQEEVSTLKG